MTKKLNVVEICAGAGGQSLGLHRAGFEHLLAVELDVSAAATLQHNLARLGCSGDVRVGDVADNEVWKPEDHRGVDLVAGGVPCPPFSVAGKQLGTQDERDLFAWAVELAARVEPKALMLENVRGLSTPRFAAYRQAVADRLSSLGYWTEWKLLHANDFGVPQLRPRFVLVALAEEFAPYFVWPDAQEATVTVGDALRDLMAANGWAHAQAWAEHANDVGPTVVGGSKKHGGADLGPTRARQGWARLGVDGRGVANAAPASDAPSHELVMPRLTNEMVARIQGWGTPGFEWHFMGLKTSVYRQIGNAFPPPVAAAVGRSVATALNKSGNARTMEPSEQHDELYALLRNRGGPMAEAELTSVLALSVDELSKRLDSLARDFDLAVTGEQGQRSISLGRFRAFRGQPGHHRHEAFAVRQSRSRVS